LYPVTSLKIAQNWRGKRIHMMTSEIYRKSMQRTLSIVFLPTALAAPAQTTVPGQPVTAAIITHSSTPRLASLADAETTHQK